MAAVLSDLFASGRIVDAILLLVAAEAALVALRPGLAGPRAPLLAGLGAGAGLLLATRAALAEAPWPWIAAALAAAFAAHLTELSLRHAETLRRREPAATPPIRPALAAQASPVRRVGQLPRAIFSNGSAGAAQEHPSRRVPSAVPCRNTIGLGFSPAADARGRDRVRRRIVVRLRIRKPNAPLPEGEAAPVV